MGTTRLGIDCWYSMITAVLWVEDHPVPVAVDGSVTTLRTVDADPTVALARVAAEARRLAGGGELEVTVSVPAHLTTHQRNEVFQAAARAGLPGVRIISDAQAIAAPTPGVVAVIRLDASVGEVSLTREGTQRLAAIGFGALGTVEGTTVAAQADQALRNALAACQLTPADLTAVYFQGPAETALTLPLVPVRMGELTAAIGAAQHSAPAVPAPAAPVTSSRRSAVWSGLRAVIALVGAGVLIYQDLNTAIVYNRAQTAGGREVFLTEGYGWGLAALLIGMGALYLGLTYRALRPGPRWPILTGAAAVSLGAAVVLSLLCQATYGLTGPVPRWTLLSTIPLTLTLGMLALVDATIGGPPRLDLPLVGLIVGVAATIALIDTMAGPWGLRDTPHWRLEHLGAFGLGYAAGQFLTTNPWRRVTIGVLLAIPARWIVNAHTSAALGALLIIAIIIWWARQPITSLAHHLHPARGSSRARLGGLRAAASKGD